MILRELTGTMFKGYMLYPKILNVWNRITFDSINTIKPDNKTSKEKYRQKEIGLIPTMKPIVGLDA